MRGSEGQVQDKVIAHLKLKGWLPVKISLCSMNGWPDILAIKDNLTIFVEVKAPGEKVDPEGLQARAHKKIREKGGIVIVTDNIDEFKKRLFWLK